MKKFTVTIITLSVIISALIAWLLVNKASDEDKSTTSDTALSTAVPSQASTPPVTQSTPATLEPTLLDAKNYQDVYAALPRRTNSFGEENYIRTQTAVLCEPVNGNHKVTSTINNRTIATFRSDFCAGFSGSVSDEMAHTLELKDNDPFKSLYENAEQLFSSIGEDGRPTPEASKNITALSTAMLDKHAGFQSLFAAESLAQAGIASKEVKTILENNHHNLTNNEIIEAQLVATQMRLCEVYGGCGPNKFLTIHYCSQRNICQPSLSSQQMWTQHLSPTVLQAANTLKSNIK